MDLVTQSLLASFADEESLPDSLDNATIFEHFVNFSAVSAEYSDEFDVEEVHTGGGEDLGIDGIAVIVNGNLVTDLAEVEDLAAANKYLEVHLVFTQAKSGVNFSGSEISNFFFGVKDFFAAKPSLPRNAEVAQKEKLVRGVYQKSTFFKRGNPTINLYYATTGKWQDDAKLLARIDNEREALFELNIFSKSVFTPLDARALQRLYTKAKNRLSKSVNFSSRITLPALPGIEESYLGYLPTDEYLKLITDDSGGIARGLFYDNVRDFQGDNPVNREIEETLSSPEQQLFVLMNNGITIVAESLNKTGDIFTIEDFQIVNGCQTSHVLFFNSGKLNAPVHLPVKLIVSKDSATKNRIIKATNRQTTVRTEELTALTDFQKSLEDYYEAAGGDCQLYYERRSQQYRSSAGIEKIRIVNVSNQIRSFASMFLGLAHQASRYYGTLLKSVESKIFIPGHPPAAYYASALAQYRFDAYIRRKLILAKYRPFRYHILSILRMQVAGTDMPAMTSNKFEKYCEFIVDILKDEKKCLPAMTDAIAVLDKVLLGQHSPDKAKDASLLTACETIVSANP
jgi:hypothetical protein